ncbi:MalY/PatB family protein [Lysinibacillus sp. LZ02]|uniref:MalY/PatB family protein n=1 Tax=Lysinibacillus sp. LZ02 TaxID=3420668 RepID=UPI003D3682B0
MFDMTVNRLNCNSVKWDVTEKASNPDKALLPMWIADMDFKVAREIKQALLNEIERGVFGYTYMPESTKDAIVKWVLKRHGWLIDEQTILFRKGVIPAIADVIQAFTQKGDSVLIAPPVYPPFQQLPEFNQRNVVHCPLIEQNGNYSMDFALLEQLLKQDDVKLFIFCNPHNPVGKVWTEAELKQISALCYEHHVLILSDEIHADVMLGDAQHTPIAKVATEEEQTNIITCMAPTKTFNLAGLQIAYMIVVDPEKRQQLNRQYEASGYGDLNCFAAVTMQTAYNECAYWVEEMLQYISANMDYVIRELKVIPKVKVYKPDATYLLWIDYRALNISEQQMMNSLVEVGGLVLDPGTKYGVAGDGFIRLNVAYPMSTIKEAVERLLETFTTLDQNTP